MVAEVGEVTAVTTWVAGVVGGLEEFVVIGEVVVVDGFVVVGEVVGVGGVVVKYQ